MSLPISTSILPPLQTPTQPPHGEILVKSESLFFGRNWKKKWALVDGPSLLIHQSSSHLEHERVVSLIDISRVTLPRETTKAIRAELTRHAFSVADLLANIPAVLHDTGSSPYPDTATFTIAVSPPDSSDEEFTFRAPTVAAAAAWVVALTMWVNVVDAKFGSSARSRKLPLPAWVSLRTDGIPLSLGDTSLHVGITPGDTIAMKKTDVEVSSVSSAGASIRDGSTESVASVALSTAGTDGTGTGNNDGEPTSSLSLGPSQLTLGEVVHRLGERGTLPVLTEAQLVEFAEIVNESVEEKVRETIAAATARVRDAEKEGERVRQSLGEEQRRRAFLAKTLSTPRDRDRDRPRDRDREAERVLAQLTADAAKERERTRRAVAMLVASLARQTGKDKADVEREVTALLLGDAAVDETKELERDGDRGDDGEGSSELDVLLARLA
mmetsp:Transcript_9085/g.28926  ORF Transcript_9085/g.28926 Transcript_9085/m.28926 type:complete len:441 (-) Transcript_9085:877-2199(-)